MSDKTVDNSVIFESVIANLRIALGSDDCELDDTGIALLWASKRIAEMEAESTLCEPYLKENETPAMCISRNRTDVDQSLRMYADELKKREELEAAQAWVPVSTPPMKRGWYLVTVQYESATLFVDTSNYNVDTGRWGSYSGCVTAWRPAPEPYTPPTAQGGQGNEFQ